jgi:phospholipid/cholesterol/gamma-HCH transport system substrate-binding protein
MRGLHRGRLPNWAFGLLVVVLTGILVTLSFTRGISLGDKYEVQAVFADSQSIRVNSPVRIAGVNVGTVTEVEPLAGEDAVELAGGDRGLPVAGGDREAARAGARGVALVRMEITDAGRPVHVDATMQIRPRLFLEGNYFVDLRPGTPSAPEAEDGFVVPITRTSSSVQLDQVLSALPADVRAHLQLVLDELGRGLARHGGTEGLRELLRTSGPAFRSTSRVAQALLGTGPHDLANLIRNLDAVVAALGRNETDLKELVTNLRLVAGALAAEDDSLERAVADLPGTIDAAQPLLAALNGSLPAARAFAIEALPGVRALPPAIDAATPLLHQVRGLVSREELRGAVADLRPTIPRLARLTRGTLPFLDEARALSSCFSEVVIPWANMTVRDPETPATGRLFQELAYGLVGIAGESRSADANGPYARVLGGFGTNTAVLPPLAGTSDQVVGVTPLPLLGGRPALGSSAKTPFRPDFPCETNEPPDLDSGDAAPPPPQRNTGFPPDGLESVAGLRDVAESVAARLERAEEAAGLSAGRARRARANADEALADLNRALADELGWQSLLEEGSR